ncbi:MAG TPA: PLP-dependent transferase, partial [Caulobacteraceae bacterium]|nr:PLP-dependent transferase [Caulobacteraceae bacterium]
CAWLARHPKVEKVFYPGFFEDGSREADVVSRQCGAYGATFSFTVAGGQGAAFRVLDRLQVFKQAVSLGGTESLACHPASTTHSGVPEADRKAIGISEGLIRLSIGVEAAKDLINDLSKALAAA